MHKKPAVRIIKNFHAAYFAAAYFLLVLLMYKYIRHLDYSRDTALMSAFGLSLFSIILLFRKSRRRTKRYGADRRHSNDECEGITTCRKRR